ncbi:hypothetical protein LTR84_010590 [Exophiala bonariae]|uniref:Cytochrome P450 oxidoreductase n=1 Tax=Exophiala bonariae TaxID=1690606 RepID=A0AAV9MVS1_9EURO|nr:hypothetical protein LTR84_010590 [Exophiala bonariae]
MFLYKVVRTLSVIPLWISAPTLVLIYLAAWIFYARTLHPLAKIPGPFWASVTRGWIVWRTYQGDMDHTQRALHQKYGYLVRIAPNEIACAYPNAIKQIYRMQNSPKKTDFYPPWGNKTFSKYPDHFSNTDEKLHAERRRIVNQVYTLSNVLQSEMYIDKCSALFIQRLGEYVDAGKIIDLGDWLQMYAFDVIGELYFGKMFGFMEQRTDYESYIASLDMLVPLITLAAVAPSYTRPLILVSSIISPAIRKAMKAIDHIATAARSCVATRSMQLAAGESVRRDLLSQLFDISHTKGEKVDFGLGEITYEAYVGLFAGSDTTAIAMRSILYHLLKNESVYDDLMAEIDAADARGELSTPVKFAEANKLPLLCACIKEGMRLHPSVGLTMPRIAPLGGLEICDVVIPEGYRIGMNAAVVQYDKSIFGADANEFRPSRWLHGDAAKMDKYMLHFGAGTRTCIGKNISLSEIHKLLPHVLRSFKLKLATDKPWKTSDLWFNKQTGILVNLKRRALSSK